MIDNSLAISKIERSVWSRIQSWRVMDLSKKTIYSVPRTLDLASIMVLTAGYAFLIAGLQRLTFNNAAIVYWFRSSLVLESAKRSSLNRRLPD